MSLPELTPPPPVPSRTQEPETFNTNTAAFLAWMATHAGELPQWADALVQAAAAANYSSASASEVAIGTGARSFAIETGKLFRVGQWVVAASASDPAAYLYGRVTAHDSLAGTLTMDVSLTGGGGTHDDWVIALSGPRGPVPSWEEIGIATVATPVAAVTFTNLPQNGSALRLRLIGASHNNGSDAALRCAISMNNGATWNSVSTDISLSMSAATQYRGVVIFDDHAADFGFLLFGGGINAPFDHRVGASGLPRSLVHVGGMNALSLSWSAGSFDAGTIILEVLR